MKKILAIILACVMVVGTAACGTAEAKPETVGQYLAVDFKENAKGTAEEVADRMLKNEAILFDGATMPVEPGLLMGFDNAKITGFEDGVMFGPMIGTIPFIGYVFTLEEGTDVEAFQQTLKDNANLRWNICNEAEEITVEAEGNNVLFVMSPKSFEE